MDIKYCLLAFFLIFAPCSSADQWRKPRPEEPLKHQFVFPKNMSDVEFQALLSLAENERKAVPMVCSYQYFGTAPSDYECELLCGKFDHFWIPPGTHESLPYYCYCCI